MTQTAANLLSIVLSETMGTFFFLTVILTTGQAIPIGIALAAAITFGSFASGAHFNPAVTLVFAIRREIPVGLALAYLAAQLTGAVLGVYVRPHREQAHGALDVSADAAAHHVVVFRCQLSAAQPVQEVEPRSVPLSVVHL